MTKVSGPGTVTFGNANSLSTTASFSTAKGTVDLGVFSQTPKVRAWRQALSERPSVKRAVAANYAERLTAFLKHHAGVITGVPAAA